MGADGRNDMAVTGPHEPLAEDLRMLLQLGQATAQERQAHRIALWISEAVTSLLAIPLGAVVLTPTSRDFPPEVHGELDNLPIDESLREGLAHLATAIPDRRVGGIVCLERLGSFPELIRRGVTTVLRCEIRTLQRSFGVLLGGFRTSPAIDARERFILSTLANQAAVALENAHERHELEQQLAELTGEVVDRAKSETPRPASRPASVLVTKLVPPPLPTGFVKRSRLDAAFDEPRSKLTLIEGPAGSGKTALAAAWLAERQPTFGWVSLDDEDADPARFWTYVEEALRRAIPDLPPDVLEAARTPGPLGAEARIAPLVNELARRSEPVILVLDGYEVVDSGTVHEDLRFLLRHLPPALRILVLTRSDPPLAIRELRARGELTELTATDLRFSDDEAIRLLNETMEAGLSEEDIGRLVDRTEGWAVALHLIGTSLRYHADSDTFIEALIADDEYLLDSLATELLRRLPERTRMFARRATVLDVLTPTLCEAVTGFNDAGELLEQLERGGLVVLPAGASRRFHHLFRETLERELEQKEPDLVRTLHQRAAGYYQSRGQLGLTIDHLLAAGIHREAAALLADHWVDFLTQGRAEAAEERLRALPDDLIRADAALSLARGWTALTVGNLDDAEVWFEAADEAARLSGGDVPVVEASSPASSAARGRAMCAFLRGDVEQVLQHSQRALALETDDSSFGWIAARVAWALGLYWRGRTNDARRAAMEVAWAAPGRGHYLAALLARGCLAALNADEGANVEASKHVRNALDLATEHGLRDHFWLTAAFTTQARLLEQEGDLSRAASEADRSVGLGRRGGGRLETAHALGVLARIRVRQGQTDEATQLVQEAVAVLDRCRDPGILTEKLDDIRAAVEAGSTKRGGPTGEPVTDRELAVLRLLPTQLSQREIANELYVSYNTVKTHARSLYRKLGASSRREAVERARQAGLVR